MGLNLIVLHNLLGSLRSSGCPIHPTRSSGRLERPPRSSDRLGRRSTTRRDVVRIDGPRGGGELGLFQISKTIKATLTYAMLVRLNSLTG